MVIAFYDSTTTGTKPAGSQRLKYLPRTPSPNPRTRHLTPPLSTASLAGISELQAKLGQEAHGPPWRSSMALIKMALSAAWNCNDHHWHGFAPSAVDCRLSRTESG